MDFTSEIKSMTDSELREICVLAVALCAIDEAMDEAMRLFWREVLKEVFIRGWAGGNDAIVRDTLFEVESLKAYNRITQ
ncbi:hypothetical protein [Ensifer sp. LCM 4579]|uniref:hypothetical protein n=1 Tax=Ensifer sp. LCM 4579 TaxID=1848292 RepID=UPI0008D8D951|nr:hypothetical protein [Ensifer sp. LCM 4579]OHV78186.1 hypothetical protein LCM4579_26955 [Ensifer sp. LCM 4579]